MPPRSSHDPPSGPPRSSVAGNVKETLESIVVAFILAFVFRAFIVEAFVIPTGSMAVTLYGDQATNTCSTCGYEYARGITEKDVESLRREPRYTVRLRCPNCDTMADAVPAGQVQRPDSGDRILVQKWPWSFPWLGGCFEPHRWDVTVFKDPRDGTTNFIKRLVGLPGEVLEIIDGDVYTAPLRELSAREPDIVAELDTLRRQVYQHGRSNGGSDSSDLPERYRQLNRRILPYLRIARKTARAQHSLWVNVYDHDFRSAGASDRRPLTSVGWHPVDEAAARAWDTAGRELVVRAEDDGPRAIEFGGKPINDFVAYNYIGMVNHPSQHQVVVGDLRLRFTWLPDAGAGGLALRMNRDQDVFVARLGCDGRLALEHQRADLPGKRQVIGEARLPKAIGQGQAVRVEFINVDFRAALVVNGREYLATKEDQYRPDLPRLLDISHGQGEPVKPTEVRIAAHRLHGRLRHLALDRDVYYRSPMHNEPAAPDPPTGLGLRNPYFASGQPWPGWGTAGQPILLRPEHEAAGKRYAGEYFMLGDNSPQSKDSRLWWEIGPHLRQLGEEYQVGTVPGDQLIGKAFFVYWPAGYRRAWAAGIGLIPNFGKMRWIR